MGKLNKKELEHISVMTLELENKGAAVLLSPHIDKQLNNLYMKQRQKQQIKKQPAFKMLDLWDYSFEELMEDIVPACCRFGCMVKPDGYCKHNQPNILLFYDMI